jgi:hypothetical protein
MKNSNDTIGKRTRALAQCLNQLRQCVWLYSLKYKQTCLFTIWYHILYARFHASAAIGWDFRSSRLLRSLSWLLNDVSGQPVPSSMVLANRNRTGVIHNFSTDTWIRLRAGRSGVRIPSMARDFFFPKTAQTDAGASYSMRTGVLPWGVQLPGREVDHWSPPSAEIKNEWSYTTTLPIRLHACGHEQLYTLTF